MQTSVRTEATVILSYVIKTEHDRKHLGISTKNSLNLLVQDEPEHHFFSAWIIFRHDSRQKNIVYFSAPTTAYNKLVLPGRLVYNNSIMKLE